MSDDKWVGVILNSLKELQLRVRDLLAFAKNTSITIHGDIGVFLRDFESRKIDYVEVTNQEFLGKYINELLYAKEIMVGVLVNDPEKKNTIASGSYKRVITSIDKCLSLLFDLRKRKNAISNDFNSDYLQTQIKNLALDIDGLRNQIAGFASLDENVDKKLEIGRAEMQSVRSDLIRSFDALKKHTDDNFKFEISRLKNHQINEVKDLVDSLNARAKLKMEENQANLDEIHSNLRNKFDELITAADVDAATLTKLVGALSGQAVAASHLRSSINERKLADKYRTQSLWVVGLMLVVVVVYTFAFADFNSPMAFATKLSIALLFLVPAGYLARESARHRDVSEYRRHIGINLLAMRAYMSDMEPQERAEFKKAMADKLFTNYKYSESGKTLDSFSDIAAVAFQKK